MLGELFFHVLEPRFEFAIRAFQCGLGVDLQIPGDVDDNEQHVPDLIFQPFTFVFVAGGNLFFQLAHLFLELVENAFDIRPVKTHTGGAGRDLMSFMDGG